MTIKCFDYHLFYTGIGKYGVNVKCFAYAPSLVYFLTDKAHVGLVAKAMKNT